MEKLVERIEELEALLAAALGRIVALEEQLRQNSRNSSKVPSSDMGRRKVPKETTGRKPGGQPGHPGTMRGPVPSDQVGEVVDLDPETCENCGTRLEAAAKRQPKAPC
jgi:transposase